MAGLPQTLGTVWYWDDPSKPITGTLNGNINRTGDRVYLTWLSLSLSWPQAPWGKWPVDFTLNGTTTSRDLSHGDPSYALDDTSFSVSPTQTSATIGWSSSDGYSGSITIDFPAGQSDPSGPHVQLVSATPHSATIEGKVDDWGTSPAGATKKLAILTTDSTSSNWVGGYTKSVVGSSIGWDEVSLSATDYDEKIGDGVDLSKGLSLFKLGIEYKTNSYTGNYVTDYTTATPPVQPQSIILTSKTYTGSGYDLGIAITGGDSTLNNSVPVITMYRYSTDDGRTWTAWANAGAAGLPWTTKTATILVGEVDRVIIEAVQGATTTTLRSDYSEPLRASFVMRPILYGSEEGLAKRVRKLYGSVNGQSKKITKLYGSVNGQSKLIYKGE